MANEPTVKCVIEDDGYHVHDYRATAPVNGRMTTIRIEHHFHSWMDEHKRLYPHVKDVSANTLRYHPLQRPAPRDQAGGLTDADVPTGKRL
jgi:hypothetical protein